MKLLIQDQIHNFKKVFVVAIKKGLYYLVVRERDQGIKIVLHNGLKTFLNSQLQICLKVEFTICYTRPISAFLIFTDIFNKIHIYYVGLYALSKPDDYRTFKFHHRIVPFGDKH